jgi:transposase
MLPHKEALEKHLKTRYGELFHVRFDLLLYDLTSTYFEGEAARNPQAQRGYSRDHRPDCKQVLLALVVSEEGFPLAYEVFDGNRADVTTLEEVLEKVESKYGRAHRVWVFDRGVVSEDNLDMLRQHEGVYLVGTPRSMLRGFEQELLSEGWRQICGEVEVKLIPTPSAQETYVLCRSHGRKLKEQAMHQRQRQRVEEGLSRLSNQVASGRMREEVTLQRRIGALLARNPQVSDLYEVHLQPRESSWRLIWRKNPLKDRWASLREGHYLLRTNLRDQDPQALWEKYVQLTEAEAAFRTLKSELAIRPIWHHRQDRVQAHILVAFLGYCLWVTLKQSLKQAHLDLSPAKALHLAGKIYSGDILLRTTDGRRLRLRRICKPEPEVADLLQALRITLPKRLNRDLELQNVVQT